MVSLLQTKEWADFKVRQGWKAHEIDNIFVLEKKLPFGQSFLYAPEIDFYTIVQQTGGFEYFLQNIENIRKISNPIFTRLEFIDKMPPDNGGNIVEKLKKYRFIKAFEEVQPEWRQVIDISKSDDEILAQMKQKGRYNIRVAEKSGVVIENPPAGGANIDDFYNIFCETAKRDGFEIRPKEYFENLMQKFASNDIAELFVAKYNGKTIAAVIATFFADTASYLYGASSNDFRNVMAPYLLHWQIIKRAKEKECKFYDLLAIEPFRDPQTAISYKENINNYQPAEDGRRKAELHKYAGITRFKEQFGGQKVQLVGSWDLIYKPTWYKLFKIAERYRRK